MGTGEEVKRRNHTSTRLSSSTPIFWTHHLWPCNYPCKVPLSGGHNDRIHSPIPVAKQMNSLHWCCLWCCLGSARGHLLGHGPTLLASACLRIAIRDLHKPLLVFRSKKNLAPFCQTTTGNHTCSPSLSRIAQSDTYLYYHAPGQVGLVKMNTLLEWIVGCLCTNDMHIKGAYFALDTLKRQHANF